MSAPQYVNHRQETYFLTTPHGYRLDSTALCMSLLITTNCPLKRQIIHVSSTQFKKLLSEVLSLSAQGREFQTLNFVGYSSLEIVAC